MDLMPFNEIDNDELDELFPKPYFPEEYEVGYDADGNEWVHARGVWYPCLENIYQDIDIDQDQETDEWDSIPPPTPLVRQTNERRACDVFGLSTVDINDQDPAHVTLDEWIDMWPESERATILRACIPPPSPLVRSTAVPIDQDDQDEDPLDYPLYDYEDPHDLD